MIQRRILVAVLLAALFAVGWWSGRDGGRGELYANVDKFVEVLHKVDENYVEPVEPAKLVHGAVEGMLQTLDPYSQYLDPREYGGLQDVTRGSFSGVGLEVGLRDRYPTVIAPIEGGPAWEAGIQTGDVILRVDGKATADLSLDDLAAALRGPKGTHVKVAVGREGEATEHEFEIVRREIVVASVPYAFVTNGVGYVRLARFSEDTDAGLRKAVAQLKAAGAKSLVLDLRRNPGGLLEQAVDVAQLFVPRGAEIVSTRGRVANTTRRFAAEETHPETAWPMAVLVDEGSASASEIVAGALQDLDRALVVGRTSFGKGSVQVLFPLRGQAGAVKLTTARYYTPSGRSIHRATPESIAADPLADDDDSEDAPEDSATAIVPAPADTVARPLFHTASGRTVRGGGGITPDLEVKADTLGPLAFALERRGLAIRIARRWEAAHPSAPLPSAAEVWPDLVRNLNAEGVRPPADSLELERQSLAALVRREIARRRGGDAAAARVALETDADFRRAASVLSRAHKAPEVFTVARDAARVGTTSAAAGTDGKHPAPKAPPAKRRGPRPNL